MESRRNYSPTIEQIEVQLRQRIANYPPAAWGRKQSDGWDQQTKFIYHTLHWNDLEKQIENLDRPKADYAVNRWFNFWSAMAVEKIFYSLPGVVPHTDKYNRLIDFSIEGINFDHKTSVFPKTYGRLPKYAWRNKAHLIQWLYESQSRQQRFHTHNRLFIILYAKTGEHWKLRAEISALRKTITAYVTGFNASRLVRLSFDDAEAVSDLIWLVM